MSTYTATRAKNSKAKNSKPAVTVPRDSANNPREKITAKFIEALQAGVAPWRKPWKCVYNGVKLSPSSSAPRNLITNKPYRGINMFILLLSPKGDTPYWLTYKQATELGGHVRKGEKSTEVVFYAFRDKKDKEGKPVVNTKGEAVKVPMLRFYYVFNVSQCDGLKHKRLMPVVESPNPVTPEEKEEETFKALEVAENLIEQAKDRIAPFKATKGSNRACYSPMGDVITVPHGSQFDKGEEYYNTLFHEIAHSTGHKDRLNREGITMPIVFGSPRYAKEELIAEMSAAYLSNLCGILPETFDNSAAYFANWIDALKGDSNLLFAASSHAQKAFDYITGTSWDSVEGESVESDETEGEE